MGIDQRPVEDSTRELSNMINDLEKDG